jgi:hypothetical protein
LNALVSSEEKMMNQNTVYEELKQIFHPFRNYYIKFYLVMLLQKWGEEIFPNRQLRIRVHFKIVKIKV